MTILARLVLFCLFLLPSYASFALSAHEYQSDQATVSFTTKGYNQQGILKSLVTFELEEDWKIYWKNPGDSGFAVSFEVRNERNRLVQTNVEWPYPEKAIDIFGDTNLTSYVYHDKVDFPLDMVGLNPNKSHSLIIRVSYGICNEICIPQEAVFELDIPAHYQSDSTSVLERFQKADKLIPNVAPGAFNLFYLNLNTKTPTLRINVSSNKGFKQVPEVFVDGADLFSGHSMFQPSLSNLPYQATFDVPLALLTDQTMFDDSPIDIVVVDGNDAVHLLTPANSIQSLENADSIPNKPITSPINLTWILVLAFVGGLILNVMPCVLPVLSVKILSLLGHHQKSTKHIRYSFIASALGIVSSFAALALFLNLLQQLGQQVGWGFHFQQPYFIIFLVILMTLFAANIWNLFPLHIHFNVNTASHSPRSYKDAFLTGCLATLLATPCTAPFLGTAAGFALAQPGLILLLIFVAMGTGMALPYLLVALFPKTVQLLPKPGHWMTSFKYIMGAFMIVTSLWLIWVLSYQWGQVSALALLGISVAILILTLWIKRILILGLLYASLAFSIPNLLIQDITPAPMDGLWQTFDQERIATSIDEGKTVLVDVTAAWCLTCKINKLTVLDRPDVIELLKQPSIVAMRADWTNKDEIIGRYLRMHARAGVPFNIVYSPKYPNGIILPELLTKNAIRKAIQKANP